jgi:DNA-binding GntR family transcriptional regulator
VTRAKSSPLRTRRSAGPASVDAEDLAGGPANSLAEQTYQQLRTLILDRGLPSGTPLNEGRLALQLGLSRTPVRETLIRLVGEGLLVRADARSYAVRTVSPREFFDSMRVRDLLERHAIDLAIERISDDTLDALEAGIGVLQTGTHRDAEYWNFDDRFHLAIAEASGNAMLARMIGQLRISMRLFRLCSQLHRQQENHAEHLAILNALRSRDAGEAKQAMASHIRGLQDDVIAAISGQPARASQWPRGHPEP